MSISLEWLINKSKKKVYAITHAKGVVRGNSTVDKDLTAIENNITSMGTTLNNIDTRVQNIATQIEEGDFGSSARVILGAATNTGDVLIPTEGWESDGAGGGYHLDITNSAIEETTVPVVALSPMAFETAQNCKLKPYCRSFAGYIRLYAESVPTAEMEVSLALIGSGNVLPVATTSSRGTIQVGSGVIVEPTTGTLSVDKNTVITQDELIDEDEALRDMQNILSQEDD